MEREKMGRKEAQLTQECVHCSLLSHHLPQLLAGRHVEQDSCGLFHHSHIRAEGELYGRGGRRGRG